MSAAPRRIWLCADDYGISPGVGEAIRGLIARGRLNATSVMVAAPSFNRSEAASLDAVNTGSPRAAIGLHLTLTAPFRPLSAGFRPLRQGAFLPLREMLVRGSLRLLNRKALTDEIAAQLRTFADGFGRPPDFIDGHQHVHLLAPVCEALLPVMKEATPDAWLRQCGSARRRPHDTKALLLDRLSRRLRRRAAAAGIATNPAFAGTYDFSGGAAADFAALFPAFLDGLPDGGVVMCHPGFVDAELERLDPLTHQRRHEHDYLAGEAFLSTLRHRGVVLS